MTTTSFEAILENNKHRIFRICKVYAVTPVEPEDLFQDVVYQLWKSLPSFKGNANINTWVYRVTLNTCLRSKMKFDKQNGKIDRFAAIQFIPTTDDPRPEDDERYIYLRQCIATLNESDTSILVLYLENLPYKEIATITGLTENHIAVKMKRIRKKLFDCITPKLN